MILTGSTCRYDGNWEIHVAKAESGGTSTRGEFCGTEESSIRFAYFEDMESDEVMLIPSAELEVWQLLEVLKIALESELITVTDLMEVIGWNEMLKVGLDPTRTYEMWELPGPHHGCSNAEEYEEFYSSKSDKRFGEKESDDVIDSNDKIG
jgi:hypothetical protein